jgi:hypothetical protein
MSGASVMTKSVINSRLHKQYLMQNAHYSESGITYLEIEKQIGLHIFVVAMR